MSVRGTGEDIDFISVCYPTVRGVEYVIGAISSRIGKFGYNFVLCVTGQMESRLIKAENEWPWHCLNWPSIEKKVPRWEDTVAEDKRINSLYLVVVLHNNLRGEEVMKWADAVRVCIADEKIISYLSYRDILITNLYYRPSEPYLNQSKETNQ